MEENNRSQSNLVYTGSDKDDLIVRSEHLFQRGLELIETLKPESANSKSLSKPAQNTHGLAAKKTNTNALEQFFLDRGSSLYHSAQFKRAIKELTNALRSNPNSEDAYFYRAMCYFNIKSYDNAISDFTSGIQLDPNFPDYYGGRGKCYFEKGDFDRAIKDYTTLINLSPDKISWYGTEGKSYKDERDRDNISIEVRNRMAAYFGWRGRCYFEKGDYDNTINDCKLGLLLDGNQGEIYFLIGVAYLRKNMVLEARDNLQVASKMGVEEANSFLVQL